MNDQDKYNNQTFAYKTVNIRPLKGILDIPGDKSISSRALIIGSQAQGEFKIEDSLETPGISLLIKCLQSLGVGIKQQKDRYWVVKGVGIGGLCKTSRVMNLGNAATSTRLLAGLLAGHGFVSFLTGTKMLCKRPMQRIIEPLSQMGAEFISCDGKIPMAIKGSDSLRPISYKLEVASAQVKSAILLAGLNTNGITTILEPTPTRNHTEIMLSSMGARITSKPGIISINGKEKLEPVDFLIPGDPSSAAYFVAAALLIPNSEITLKKICVNETRMGFYNALKKMGADIRLENYTKFNNEPVADITIKHSELKAITLTKEIVPTMIDEFPIFSIIAIFAEGVTTMQGLSELKFKESNRFLAIINGLMQCGVNIETHQDNITIQRTKQILPAAKIKTYGDHRIAMSFLILNMVTGARIRVDNTKCIEDSFPGFLQIAEGLGLIIH
jgi:3-phosphoshikimate 1-carboxyvinyltransferase